MKVWDNKPMLGDVPVDYLAVRQHHGHHGHARGACYAAIAAVVATSTVVLIAAPIAHVCVLPIALLIPSIAAAAPLIVPSIPTSLRPPQIIGATPVMPQLIVCTCHTEVMA